MVDGLTSWVDDAFSRQTNQNLITQTLEEKVMMQRPSSCSSTSSAAQRGLIMCHTDKCQQGTGKRISSAQAHKQDGTICSMSVCFAYLFNAEFQIFIPSAHL